MTSVAEILLQRGHRYGEYINVATTSQELKHIIAKGATAHSMPDNDMLESLDMIANKIARIVNGDPYYKDSWQDIAGYAQLIVDKLDRMGL
jgi:sulfur carrier protein ThiS